MRSERFGRDVVVTGHAWDRMSRRGIGLDVLLDLIETGEVRYKDERRIWVAKGYPERPDNLICAAVALEDVLVVKTVMHHFVWG